MIVGDYNDYELLYLIQERSDEALEIMFQKYEKLIYAKIYKYYFKKIAFEDCVQEGRLMLLKAIKRYSDAHQKTFTKFFELLLERKLIDLLRKDLKDTHNYELADELITRFKSNEGLNNVLEDEKQVLKYQKFSKLEQEVYQLKFLKGYKVKEISRILNIESVQISNTLQRIKKKQKTY